MPIFRDLDYAAKRIQRSKWLIESLERIIVHTEDLTIVAPTQRSLVNKERLLSNYRTLLMKEMDRLTLMQL